MSVIVPAGWVVKQDGGYCPWRKWPRTQDIFALLFDTPAPPAPCSSCPNFVSPQRWGSFLKPQKGKYFWYLCEIGLILWLFSRGLKKKNLNEKRKNRQERKRVYNGSMDRDEFPPLTRANFTHVCMWVCVEITGRPIPSFLCYPALQPAST